MDRSDADSELHVIHVITRLIVGGAQENTVASVLGLHRKPRLRLKLISGPTAGSEGSLVPHFAPCPELLEILPSLVRPIAPWHDVMAWRTLTSLFRAARPQLVHTHSGKAGILGRLAAARANVPCIVHTIHGPSFGKFQNAAANWIFRGAEQHAARVTTHFVSVADAMTQQYLAAGIGRPSQFTLVRSGFDLQPFLAVSSDQRRRAEFGFKPEHIVVGKLARLVPRKGHADLIAAAPALIGACPRLRFLLVGDGPLRAELTARVHSLGLTDYFVFTGLVPPVEIPTVLSATDLVVHLSQREGLARALTQALAAGRPVIAYDCDGAGEVCLEGQTGFLIPPGDRDALARSILDLAANPELRIAFGQRGRSLISASFSTEKMVNDLEALYWKLAAAMATAPGWRAAPRA